MYNIVSTFRAGRYLVLEIDKDIEEKHYNAYKINGKVYPAVLVYDLPRHIGIECAEDQMVGTIECVML